MEAFVLWPETAAGEEKFVRALEISEARAAWPELGALVAELNVRTAEGTAETRNRRTFVKVCRDLSGWVNHFPLPPSKRSTFAVTLELEANNDALKSR